MTIAVVKTPAFEDSFEVSSFSGHNAGVNSLHFSSKDEYLLSSSGDKSAVLWSIDFKRGKKALVINRINASLPEDANNYKIKKDKDNPVFTHEIKKASFYYHDKFISLCSGNSLYFYKYELSNKNCKDDIKRLQSKGVYKQVQHYENAGTHSIPTYTLHNKLRSHLAVLG